MPDQLAIRYTHRRDLSVTVVPEAIAVGTSATRRPPSKIDQRYVNDKALGFLRFSPRTSKALQSRSIFPDSVGVRAMRPRLSALDELNGPLTVAFAAP
jgi:hypothetical protein